MDRITIKNLRALATRINTVTGSPQEAYTRTGDRMVANIGNFHISQAYGGYCLHRMHNEGGGVMTPVTHGHVPARQLWDMMQSYLSGIEFAKEQQEKQATNA